MSFAGFVFDMIRRDKENRNLRLLRRERLNERLDKMHKGRRMPHNTTAEDMEKITKFTRQKEHSEQKHTVRMMLIIIGGCIYYCIRIGFLIYPLIPQEKENHQNTNEFSKIY